MVNGRYGNIAPLFLALPLLCALNACGNSSDPTATKPEKAVTMPAQQPLSTPPPPTGDAQAKKAFGRPPAHAAVVLTTEDSSGLSFADLGNGQVHPLDGPDSSDQPFVPGWSPDDQKLLFRIDKTLYYWTPSHKPSALVQAIAIDAVTPYAFSNDGFTLAVSLSDSIVLLSLAATAPNRVSHKSPLPSGCLPVDLLWSSNGNQLFSLCRPDNEQDLPQLILMDRLGGITGRKPAPGITRLLGWRDGILAARLDPFADDVGILSGTGEFRSLRANVESESVLRYASGPDLLVLQESREDMGDPIRLRLASPERPDSRPWLEHFPTLADLSFSSDGRWAMFVDTKGYPSDENGGDVYLVAVGSEEAKLVLKGLPGKRSYSLPTPQSGVAP